MNAHVSAGDWRAYKSDCVVRACLHQLARQREYDGIQHVKLTRQPTHRRDIRTRTSQRTCRQQHDHCCTSIYEHQSTCKRLVREKTKNICSYVGWRTAVHRYQYRRNYNDRVDFTIIDKRSSHSMPYWSNTRTCRYCTKKKHSIKVKNIAIQNLISANTQSLPDLPGGSTAISSAGVDTSKLWTVSALAALPLTPYCQLARIASRESLLTGVKPSRCLPNRSMPCP